MTNYVVTNQLPARTVESLAFRKMFDGIIIIIIIIISFFLFSEVLEESSGVPVHNLEVEQELRSTKTITE